MFLALPRRKDFSNRMFVFENFFITQQRLRSQRNYSYGTYPCRDELPTYLLKTS